MKRLLAVAILICTAWAAPNPELPVSVFDVTAFGAKGDGKTNDTPAIKRAIEECARLGGGVVYIPSGSFLTGTIVLRSNITLHISPGATLWGSRMASDFQPPHLIYAKGEQNVAIEGGGAIDGNGDAFWGSDFRPKPERPLHYIQLEDCRNVRIENIHLRHLPGWGIRPLRCNGVVIHGISIVNDMRSPNTDGIDPDCSRNVMISDSYIETGDDAICLKSANLSKEGGGGKPSTPPTENLTVTNCILISNDSAVKFGTDSYGDFRNCTFSNCVISGSRFGLAMYIKDGGTVEGIVFSNITIDTSVAYYNKTTNSKRQWVEYPVLIDLEKRTADSAVGRIRDVMFTNIRIRTKGRVLVEGMPEQMLENISFDNILLRETGFENVENLHKPRGVKGLPPAPPENDYAPVPAAMVFANIRGLNLRDVRVFWDTGSRQSQDYHALYLGRAEDVVLNGFAGGPAGDKLAAIGAEDVRRLLITASRPDPGTAVFLGLAGTPLSEVSLWGNYLGNTRAAEAGHVHVHLR